MVEETAERLRGKVKMFSGRGYGFINPEGKEETPDSGVFFHISEVEDRESLEEGQLVSYEIGEGREGKQQAKKVKREETEEE